MYINITGTPRCRAENVTKLDTCYRNPEVDQTFAATLGGVEKASQKRLVENMDMKTRKWGY